jgi:predicted protein tyrosine phosphatase
MRALFVCTQNKLRSPTAQILFAEYLGIQTDSAGLGDDATVILSQGHIEWATIIFVMEQSHRKKLLQKFRNHLNGKQVICLSIPDEYEYMQPELIDILIKKVESFL